METSDKVIALSDGRQMGYSEFGDPKGKPVFYFHGWPGSRKFGIEIDETAKDLGIRIISPDRPGYGLSDYQKDRQLLDYPDDVLQLADSLGVQRFAVMGVSGGGPYAAVCAFKIPRKITKVGIAVGLAPMHIPNAFDGMTTINTIGWKNFGKVPGLAEFASWLSNFQFKYLPYLNNMRFPADVDNKMMDQDFNNKMKTSMKEAFRQGIKGPAQDLIIYSSEYGFDLKDIRVPVYLWYGDRDKNVSLNMGKYYASQIKGSKLVIYKGEGHFSRMNHQQVILKTLIS